MPPFLSIQQLRLRTKILQRRLRIKFDEKSFFLRFADALFLIWGPNRRIFGRSSATPNDPSAQYENRPHGGDAGSLRQHDYCGIFHPAATICSHCFSACCHSHTVEIQKYSSYKI